MMSSSADYRFAHSTSASGANPLPRKTDGLQKNRTSVGSAEHTLGSELPTRVALFLPSLGGGGAERVMVTLANALAERRFAVDLVLWTESGPLRSLLYEKVHVVALGTHNPVRLVFGFARFLKTSKPDVVISALFVGNIIAALAKATSERITVIYNPIDLAGIEAMAGADETASWNVPTIINVGRLVEQKDQETLVRAFAKVRSRRPCRLVILGEGEKREVLVALAQKLGVGSEVLMPGFIANPYSWMKKSAVFVLSSKFEGLPTVLIEAMQCGIPVISADCPSGPAEILEHGQWGRLFLPGDVDALASAIEDALDGKLVADVRRRATDFSIVAAVSRYVALFPNKEDRDGR